MQLNFRLISTVILSVLYAVALPTERPERRGSGGNLDPYTKCLNKGTTILEDIAAATGDRAGVKDKYNEIYAPLSTTESDVGQSSDATTVASLLGLDLAELHLAQVSVARPDTEVAYKNYFDVTNGIIVAAHNFNELFFYDANSPTSPKGLPEKTSDNSLQWNNIVAEQYKSLGGSLAGLSHIVRFEITNEDTKAVIEQALGDKSIPVDEGGWKVTTPDSDIFKALLGTDNGQGAGYLLKDYRVSMTGTDIEAIRVKEDDDEMFMIIDFSSSIVCDPKGEEEGEPVPEEAE